jgi:hypothetical protein
MRHTTVRQRAALALVAWLAQLFLPVVHAAIMASPRAEMLGWCGDPSRAAMVAAAMPSEIREGLGLDGVSADHLVECEKLCASGSAPPLSAISNTVVALRAVGLEPAPAPLPAPRSREQAPTPPSHGPPARG